jgi:hypothetical protein
MSECARVDRVWSVDRDDASAHRDADDDVWTTTTGNDARERGRARERFKRGDRGDEERRSSGEGIGRGG